MEFKKQLGEPQREPEHGGNTDSHIVYNEAVARAYDLIVDLRQMERKELSARNDKNKILNLIEQHAQSCKGLEHNLGRVCAHVTASVVVEEAIDTIETILSCISI
jgi:hypothetical protein